jgi:predicted metalloprotease with PDZ domain
MSRARAAFRFRFFLAFFLVVPAARAQPLEPVRYTLRFPAPHTHYVEVEAVVPSARQPQIELYMPVWTPGSYLVREYSRNVERVVARTADRRPLAVEKTAKNRWRVRAGGAASFTLAYRVYGREMTVRTNWIDDRFAMLNGAATFLTLAERAVRPHDVRLEPPSTWPRSISALPPAPDGAPHHYVAPDFDTLVDSPIFAGNPAVYEFDVDGKPHSLVSQGEAGVWDGPRSARDVEQIVREHRRMWGSLPYDRYVFFNVLLGEGSGGLEHKNSVMMIASRWATATRRRYLSWLSLVSHEFFHAWNVKRLRPAGLGPFDYEREVYTRGLWVSEGFTDYYADLALARAGLMTRDEYLRELSSMIEQLQTTPGRLVQPAEMASFDAWIRHYRPDENSPNVAMSYYTKGAVVAWLLDAKVRRATAGAKSLDDVMRLAFGRYSGARGFTEDEFRQVVAEVGGADAAAWLRTAVETTDELDYRDALDWLGLRFTTSPPRCEMGRYDWQGLRLRTDAGRLLVITVYRGTPAYDAGFNVDDEIVAIGDFRVRPDQWEARVETLRPGEKLSVLVARRDELRRIEINVQPEPLSQWGLEVLPGAPAEQQQHLSVWLIPGAPA